ncbi:MAG: HD domain-containing protein, partial [Gammaproteobacteria bacterium]
PTRCMRSSLIWSANCATCSRIWSTGASMCEKGIWVSDIKPDLGFSGFFLTRCRAAARAMLLDSSGTIELPLSDGTRLDSGRLVWISSRPVQDGHRPPIISALPVQKWSGNPFAFIEPDLPGYPSAKSLHDHIEHIADPEIRQLLYAFFGDRQLLRAFMKAPASIRHHHAWPGGLATHTLETLDMASRITTDLRQGESDLVTAACLLHDAGKAYEYTAGGTRLSRRGDLLGHEVTLLELLSPALDSIWERGHPKRLLLLHLLTAKPAPRWTGIRHPRTRLVSLVRFADQWSANRSHAVL